MLFQRCGLLVCVTIAVLNAWLRKDVGIGLDTPNGRWVLFVGTTVLVVLLWNMGREGRSRRS